MAMKSMKSMKLSINQDKGQVRSSTTSKAKDSSKAKIDRAVSNAFCELDMSDDDVQHLKYLFYKEFRLKLPEINIYY